MIQIDVLRGFYDDIDMMFTCLHPVVDEFIVVIGHLRDTVGIIDLEVVPAGVCVVTVTTKER